MHFLIVFSCIIHVHVCTWLKAQFSIIYMYVLNSIVYELAKHVLIILTVVNYGALMLKALFHHWPESYSYRERERIANAGNKLMYTSLTIQVTN